jgi:putative intracellular protease/amidase
VVHGDPRGSCLLYLFIVLTKQRGNQEKQGQYMRRVLLALFFSIVSLIEERAVAQSLAAAARPPVIPSTLELPAYQPRFSRTRPVVAVIGENTFTELTDYVVPYAVLVESGAAEVIALATQPGPIQMFPALKFEPQATSAEFDTRFPEGADYVIVPAVHNTEDPALLTWVATQAAKGAKIVGVCDGVWVLANAGLLKGRRATGHWYSFGTLEKQFPETTWVKDQRYVVDGDIVTTTGVTASLPVSLALVEAIAGHAQAETVARTLGITDWSPTHHSDLFHLKARHLFTAASNWLSFWSYETVGVPVAQGSDEIALALVADAYSRTYRSSAVSLARSPETIRMRRGLILLPDNVAGTSQPPDRILPTEEVTLSLDHTLKNIAQAYGRATSAFVALQLEYNAAQ